MLGKTHIFIANLSLVFLGQAERYILFPRWGGIESGATLSDEFRIMWEPGKSDSKSKQLVHRCYIDSDNSKNHGCITRASDHAEGSISFINDYLNGDLGDVYNEIEFLENLGMFLGIISHHIADLCTPVHVGHILDLNSLGYLSLPRFHNKVERDILRFQNESTINIPKPKIIKISDKYFWDIAQETYTNNFLHLHKIYKRKNKQSIIDMASQTVSNAIYHTTNVWHTILTKTKMAEKNGQCNL